ncbi:MAG: PQQ-binding-like beta-propeller repeat protein [bacterium]
MRNRWIVLILISLMICQLFALPTLAAGQLAASASPMYRYNPAHTGQSAYPGPVTGRVKWSFPTYHRILSTPAVGPDGSIYFGGGDRRLWAVTPTGGERWNFVVWGMADSSPAVSDTGTIFFGAGDSLFYAVDSKGKEVWKYLTKYPNASSPILASDGTVYFAAGDGTFNAMPADGRKLLWSYQIDAEILSSPARDAAGNFYFGAEDGYLYSLTPSGQLRWKFPTGSGIEASPAVDSSGNVYFGSKDFFFYALDSFGILRWSFRADGPILSSPALSAEGVLYFGSNDYFLYALRTSDGAKLWSFDSGSAVDTSPSLDSQGRIYFGAKDKYFYALKKDGSLLWKLAFPNGFSRSSAVIAPDCQIYVGCLDSRLYCITGDPPAGPPPSPSPSPSVTPTATIAPSVVFQLAPTPTRLEMSPGSKANLSLSLATTSGSGQAGTLEFSAPPGFLCSFSPPVFTLSNTVQTLTAEVFVPEGFAPGIYYLEIRAVVGEVRQAVAVEIRVPELTFPDLSVDYWAYPSIASLVQRQVLRGYPDGSFRPAGLVTRAEFAKMFVLSFGMQPAEGSHVTFPDVPPTHWAYGFIESAVVYGLIEGYPDGTFQPEGRVTMAEGLTMIVRARRFALVAPQNLYLRERGAIRPLSSADWYFLYAGAVFAQGILRNEDPHLTEPIQGGAVVPFNDPTTRAQVAVLLDRAAPPAP